MEIWVDDVRPAPDGYIWCKSTNEALRVIRANSDDITIIDLDHDAGDYANEGGDFIEILRELERLSRKVTYVNGVAFHNYWHGRIPNIWFRLHTFNPVGAANMRAIIQRNGWNEVF